MRRIQFPLPPNCFQPVFYHTNRKPIRTFCNSSLPCWSPSPFFLQSILSVQKNIHLKDINQIVWLLLFQNAINPYSSSKASSVCLLSPSLFPSSTFCQLVYCTHCSSQTDGRSLPCCSLIYQCRPCLIACDENCLIACD